MMSKPGFDISDYATPGLADDLHIVRANHARYDQLMDIASEIALLFATEKTSPCDEIRMINAVYAVLSKGLE